MITESIDRIVIGERDRDDLGDIDALGRSIADVGLLHPVVITPDRRLVAGGRRLAAVRALGWKTVPVTVVNLDTVERALRAEADENTERKSLTPTEAAKARARRSVVLAPLAEEREKAGRPSSNLDEGPATSRATRKLAATGTGYSGSTLDKVDKTRALADDPAKPAPVREAARAALTEMDTTGKVDAPYRAATLAEKYADAVAEFPDLAHYADRPAKAVSLAETLRACDPRERAGRVETLRRSIAADQRQEGNEVPAHDYVADVDVMFSAVTTALRSIRSNGGVETVAAAMSTTDRLTVEVWADQFRDLAEACHALADACKPSLRRVQ